MDLSECAGLTTGESWSYEVDENSLCVQRECSGVVAVELQGKTRQTYRVRRRNERPKRDEEERDVGSDKDHVRTVDRFEVYRR